MKTAVLMHLLDWQSSQSYHDFGGGVSIHCTKNTQVEKLYNRLCESKVEGGSEGFNFRSHLIISDSAHDELFPYFGGPYSIVSKICNIIVICTSYPLGLCQIITSKDDFANSWNSFIPYEFTPQMEIISAYPGYITISGTKENADISISHTHFPRLNDDNVNEIILCWNNLNKLLGLKGTDNHRLNNALSYFFYSWCSYDLEHVCLNLAIVLESLFSPPSQHELSHRIAFNVSKFLGESRDQRESLYNTIKSFYSVRSKIVHGGEAKIKDLYLLTPEVFHLCTIILKRIFFNYELALCFSKESERSLMLEEWLFGE